MNDALKEAYGDIFLIKSHPTKSDQVAITGKFKSYHNVSDDVSQRMSKTFFALLSLADLSAEAPRKDVAAEAEPLKKRDAAAPAKVSPSSVLLSGLHYNVQIHLPATKDVEVYNAIFKSLKEHFVE